ncbi:MAG: hypothetical protein K2L89_03975 [Muribaculaceae bacterium]|nr:hypothetical protein [Muribaculaceae bacterium]
MKNGLIIFAAIALLNGISSASGKDLIVSTADGSTGYPLKNMREITFNNDNLTVVTTDSEIEFPIDLIDKISFGTVSTSDITLIEDSSDLKITGDVITANTVDTAIGIYDLKGIMLIKGKGSVNISSLPDGVYLAVSKGKVLKFFK